MPMAEWNPVQLVPGAFAHRVSGPERRQSISRATVGLRDLRDALTVQSLWWSTVHADGVSRRVYPMLRAAADFLVAFVKKGDDGKYHIIPTVSPENWGATVDYRLNKDCILDLALTEFLLDAMLEGSQVLGADAALRAKWRSAPQSRRLSRRRRPFGRVG
jgi:hypothetical protein